MKKGVVLISVMMLAVSVSAAMPREDVIEVPAIGEGLCVHNLFQSNMVLQRDKPISIWGWADNGDTVTVALNDKEATAKAEKDRSWKVTFPALPATSDPMTITVSSSAMSHQPLTMTNVLVGDVWLLGGQSNMEFPLARIENGALEIVSANFDNMRILTVPAQNGPDNKKGFPRLHEWSSWSGRHYRKGDWDICSPASVRELSAIGYVFARRIHMATGVPIGVIDMSRGGTTVETWTPDPVLREIDTEEVKELLDNWDTKVKEYDPKKDLEDRVKRHNDWVAKMKEQGKEIPDNKKAPTDLRPGPAFDQNRPGNCYASMISPIAGIQVKGAIWHQGYNNCFNGSRGADMYYQVFPEMIRSWRAAFNNTNMAFGIITLCTQGSTQTRDDYCSHTADAGPNIREAQYKTFVDLYNAGDKNIGFTSCYDLHRRWYHPQWKVPVGERIARWALATQYGFERDVRWKPPMVKEMKIEDGKIMLYMDVAAAAVDDGGPMKGFAIAGVDGMFHPADINHFVKGKDSRGRPQKDSKILVLSSPMVPQPVHYRYAWARSPWANIQAQGNTDIPMATQRSDTWSTADMYKAYTGKDPVSPTKLDRGERGELSRALKASDLERRLQEAKTLIKENDND